MNVVAFDDPVPEADLKAVGIQKVCVASAWSETAVPSLGWTPSAVLFSVLFPILHALLPDEWH